MKYFVEVTIAIILSISLVQSSNSSRNSTETPRLEKLHVFLLMVPDSAVDDLRLRSKYRQDEEEGTITVPGESFAQTGQYIGQIIQGVLGGDVRPIFSGTVGFVDERNAQANLNNFFGTIAPTLNLALREFYTRAQVYFGFATTPNPATAANSTDLFEANNATTNGNGTVILRKQQLPPPEPTTAWQYVLNQIQNPAPTSTVQPLPLITINRPSDEDDDGEAFKIVFDE